VEERTRFAAFVSNLAAADERNAAERASGVAGAAVHGITKFMDLTPEEFKNGYLNAVGRDAVRVFMRMFKIESGARET